MIQSNECTRMFIVKAVGVGLTADRSRRGFSIVTVLFTVSSVRVDRRGTCSIGSRAVAARARAGSRHRCRVHSLKATLRSVRATQDLEAAARVPVVASLPSPAGTCAGSTATSTGIRTESVEQINLNNVSSYNTVYHKTTGRTG